MVLKSHGWQKHLGRCYTCGCLLHCLCLLQGNQLVFLGLFFPCLVVVEHLFELHEELMFLLLQIGQLLIQSIYLSTCVFQR